MSALPPDPLAIVRLHQLEGFFYVASHSGYARAVEHMPYAITEPALHQQVRKLERSLGVRLLERAPRRRMALTPAGRRLFSFVQPYFTGLGGVLRDVSSETSTALRVGVEPLFVDVFAEALAKLRRAEPGLGVSLFDGGFSELAERVTAGELDLALGIRIAERARAADLTVENLGPPGFLLVVPERHPLAKKRPPLTPEQLRGVELVSFERDSPGRRLIDESLAALGVEHTVVAESTSVAGLQALVRAGVGPAFIPTLGAQRHKRAKQSDGTVAFDVSEDARPYLQTLPDCAAALRPGNPHPLVERLLQHLRARWP